MKKIVSLLMGAVLLVSVSMVWAAETAKTDAVSTPSANSTPVAKAKTKKAKKKVAAKKKAESVWYCSMGDYTGSKTADGKCPKCGMDLIEKK